MSDKKYNLPKGNAKCCHVCSICLTPCNLQNICTGACAGCPHPCWADLSEYRKEELERQARLGLTPNKN